MQVHTAPSVDRKPARGPSLADHNPPSSLRIPVAVLLGLAMPPVGLLAWIALSGSRRAEYLRSNWVRTGLAAGVVSAVPLLTVAGAAGLGLWPDPNPNPIGLGLVLAAGGSLATILIAIGILLVRDR
jgi:hypothetical protein